MMMMSTLYCTNTLSWILMVPAHCNNNLRVNISLHSNPLLWSRASSLCSYSSILRASTSFIVLCLRE